MQSTKPLPNPLPPIKTESIDRGDGMLVDVARAPYGVIPEIDAVSDPDTRVTLYIMAQVKQDKENEMAAKKAKAEL